MNFFAKSRRKQAAGSRRRHRVRPRTQTPAAVAVALAGITSGAYGTVEVNVTRVGYPTLQQGDVIRGSAWVPVVVDLALVNQPGFDGYLRAGQFDIDGDFAFDRVETHLRADTGGTQRVFLYVLARSSRGHDRFHVALFDEHGEGVQVVSQGVLTFRASPAQEPVSIDDDALLILSVSDAVVGRIQDLLNVESEIRFARTVHVAHMAPTDLPELWIGLEMVDYVVWDDARPEQLTQRQVQAVVEWVRQGGTLLMAASRTAASLRAIEALQAILPVDIGNVSVVENLPLERERLTAAPRQDNKEKPGDRTAWWQTPFPSPVPIVDCALRPGATRVPDAVEYKSNLFTRRRFGAGQVVYSGVVLRDFLSAPCAADGFFRELLRLPTTDQTERDPPRAQSLFSTVSGPIGFVTSGGMYLLLATIFSVVYAAAATLGTWALLGSRGWRRHSWTAFAVTGAAASVLSVFGVNAVRGFGGERLRQVSMIDLEAGQRQAVATTLFGLKVGTDREVDLWLPEEALSAVEPARTDCFLRPLSAGNSATGEISSFSDPETYRLVPGSAVLDDVRIRATLKRLEGRWRGLASGTVHGQVTVRGTSIVDGSYVANELGTDLNGCYLLQPTKAAADTSRSRSQLIYAFPVGDLPGDGTRVDLVERCYRPAANETKEQWRRKHLLAALQREWGAEFKSLVGGYGALSDVGIALGQERNALLLLSTLGDYEPEPPSAAMAALIGTATWSRDRLRRLDLRDQLDKDSAVLIGFADEPGPVRLFRRSGERPFTMLKPDERRSWSMYRIRVPMTILDADASEDEPTDVR